MSFGEILVLISVLLMGVMYVALVLLLIYNFVQLHLEMCDDDQSEEDTTTNQN